MAKRLTDNHPLKVKFNALEEFMTTNKIQLEWDGYHMNLIDTDSGFTTVIKESESGIDVNEIPYLTECKLVTE